MASNPRQVDVAIIGGGLAGAALAQQLRRTVPAAAVALFERSEKSTYKVGESTVELASHYLVRKLGLSSYLYHHQLPKNGLRFFFDTPERDAPIERMGEIGTVKFPEFPSFQLDRAALDNALLEQAATQGAHIERGAKVTSIVPGTAGQPHELQVQDGQCETTIRARWLVDASGRTRMLQKTLRTPPLPIDHPIASSWGRFEGVVDIDALPLPQWHARVGHTSRVLSTNQFCYPGYWIWFIPLRGSVTSVGWVGRTSQFAASWRKPPGFLAMMRQHGAVASLMERAECIDLMSFGQLGYGTSWVFRPADRLALVGEAAAFADPFYSPGSDFIALENDFVTDLVARDLGGESADQVVAMGARYDAFIRFRFDAAMLLYRDLYGVLGSRELLQLKWDFDIANYYNLWFYAYLHDLHLDAGWLDSQLSQKDYILAGLRNFSRLFQSLSQHLWTRGQYHRRNLDVFSTALGRCDFLHHISDRRPRKDVLRQTGRIFNDTYRQAAAISGIPGADTLPDRPLFEFMLDNATWADGLTTG